MEVIKNVSSCLLGHLHFVHCGAGIKPWSARWKGSESWTGGWAWMDGVWRSHALGAVANSLQDSGGECTSQWWLMSPIDETSIFRKWQNILGNFSGPSGVHIKNAYIITFFVSFFKHHPREKGRLDFLRFWKETFTVYFVGLPRVWY